MMTSGPGRPFVSARWESLVLRTELDSWHGSDLNSLVGFRFVDTRIRGVGVPWHRTFEEVNLRFYVRRTGPDGSLRRAVVFIKELVPRRAIVTVARLLYNEPYTSVAMNNQVSLDAGSGGTAACGWMHRGFDYRLQARVFGAATVPVPRIGGRASEASYESPATSGGVQSVSSLTDSTRGWIHHLAVAPKVNLQVRAEGDGVVAFYRALGDCRW